MHFSSPEASMGFSRLLASITPPEAEPAPMIMWISSMKTTAPGVFTSSLTTALKRFSKSPRYLVPAISAPRSSE